MPTVPQKGLRWACRCIELLSTRLEHATQGMQDILFVSWQVKGFPTNVDVLGTAAQPVIYHKGDHDRNCCLPILLLQVARRHCQLNSEDDSVPESSGRIGLLRVTYN